MAADFWESVAGGESEDGGYVPPPASRPSSVPTRKTAQGTVDEWNAQMRQSPVYLNFMQRNGLSTDGRVKLSKSQQSALERDLASAGMPVPGGMHIDQGGNLNQKNTLGRNVAIGAAATGAALTGFGMAGMGPMSGLFGAGTTGLGLGGPMGYGAITPAMAAAAPTSAAAAAMVPLASAATTGLGLGGPAGYGALAPSLAAENTMFGAPQAASMMMPAAHGMSNIALPAAGGGGAPNAMSGLFGKIGGWPQVAAGGFNLLQAQIAANSAKKAAQIQAQYGNRALDFEMQRYKDAQGNFTPFLQGGQKAFTNLGDILSTPRSYTSDLERLARGGQ